MSNYLGTPGRMVELKCPSSQQVDMGDRFSFEPTLEGRIKGQAQPLQRRTWSLGTSDATTPSQQAAILGFINGSWGSGPFNFVSTDAPVTNMLTPTAAASREYGPLVSNLGFGGPVQVAPGDWEGSSILSMAPTEFGNGQEIILGTDFVPVTPGVPVTGSAWALRAGGRLRLYWYPEGSSVPMGTATSVMFAASTWSRIWVTATPPEGAASCRLIGFELERVTRPAITWTSTPFEWAAGEGCPKAVIHAASRNLVIASRDPRGGRYANLSYTITEVG